MWNRILRFFGLVTYSRYEKLMNDCAEVVTLTVAYALTNKDRVEPREEKKGDSPVFADERPKKRTSKSKKV